MKNKDLYFSKVSQDFCSKFVTVTHMMTSQTNILQFYNFVEKCEGRTDGLTFV